MLLSGEERNPSIGDHWVSSPYPPSSRIFSSCTIGNVPKAESLRDKGFNWLSIFLQKKLYVKLLKNYKNGIYILGKLERYYKKATT